MALPVAEHSNFDGGYDPSAWNGRGTGDSGGEYRRLLRSVLGHSVERFGRGMVAGPAQYQRVRYQISWQRHAGAHALLDRRTMGVSTKHELRIQPLVQGGATIRHGGGIRALRARQQSTIRFSLPSAIAAKDRTATRLPVLDRVKCCQ